MIEQEAVTNRNGWTMTTLFLHMESEFASLRVHQEAQLTDLRRLLDERYITQTKSLETAFSAQQLAMATALTAAKQAVDTALASAKEATTKSEENAERRFESFRIENNTQSRSVAEKLDEEKIRMDLRLGDLTKRMDLNQGQGAGADKSKTQMLALGGLLIAGGGLLVKVVFP